MFEDFIQELEVCLKNNNIRDIEEVVNQYREKYKILLTSGKSEFECIITLGDPQEIADNLSGKEYSAHERLERNLIEEESSENVKEQSKSNKPPTKAGIIMTDIFYMTPITILSAAALVALIFLSGLIGFAGFSYCVMSWTVFATLKGQLLGFAMSMIGVIMFIGGAVLTVWLTRSILKGIKDYKLERKNKLALIENK